MASTPPPSQLPARVNVVLKWTAGVCRRSSPVTTSSVSGPAATPGIPLAAEEPVPQFLYAQGLQPLEIAEGDRVFNVNRRRRRQQTQQYSLTALKVTEFYPHFFKKQRFESCQRPHRLHTPFFSCSLHNTRDRSSHLFLRNKTPACVLCAAGWIVIYEILSGKTA